MFESIWFRPYHFFKLPFLNSFPPLKISEQFIQDWSNSIHWRFSSSYFHFFLAFNPIYFINNNINNKPKHHEHLAQLLSLDSTIRLDLICPTKILFSSVRLKNTFVLFSIFKLNSSFLLHMKIFRFYFSILFNDIIRKCTRLLVKIPARDNGWG